MHPTLIHIHDLLKTSNERLDNARADIDRYAEALRASEGQGNVQECLDVLTAATTRREAALHDSDCLAVVATLLEQDRQYSVHDRVTSIVTVNFFNMRHKLHVFYFGCQSSGIMNQV